MVCSELPLEWETMQTYRTDCLSSQETYFRVFRQKPPWESFFSARETFKCDIQKIEYSLESFHVVSCGHFTFVSCPCWNLRDWNVRIIEAVLYPSWSFLQNLYDISLEKTLISVTKIWSSKFGWLDESFNKWNFKTEWAPF